MARRKAKKPAETTHASGLVIREARLENARPFRWAWEQRVLMGYLNLQIGEEGIGKGNLTAWIAARITRGELPGDLYGKPKRVAFVGDEDAWEHIWVPRLEAAGANLRGVRQIVSGANGVVDVHGDAEAIVRYAESDHVALVCFDQLLDNLGFADHWKDKEVRDAINPLRRIAQETGVALLASMHPNKRTGSFRDRVSGSAAFNALSRSSLLVAEHPREQGRVVVVRAKGNYSIDPPAFEFRIEEEALSIEDRVIKTSRITDIRETQLRRDDVLAAGEGGRGESQSAQARDFLRELFVDGKTRPAKEVLEQMEAEGFNERTAQRARRDLDLKTWKDGYQGGFVWGYEKPRSKRSGQ